VNGDHTDLPLDDAPSRRQLLAKGLAAATAGLGGAVLLDAGEASAKNMYDLTKRTNGAVTIIGDSSVLFGMSALKYELRKRKLGPYRCDSRPARTLAIRHRGVSTALSFVTAYTMRPAVVIALGGGDTGIFKHSTEQIRDSMGKVLAKLGNRQIGLSTTWSFRAATTADRYNTVCWEAAAANPNVVVGDWGGPAQANPKWFGRDGAHFTLAGQKARNTFLADLALQVSLAAQAAAAKPA